MSYSRKSVDCSEFPEQKEVRSFYRSKKSNPYLASHQVLNIEDYVDENTVNVIDADTMAFQVASSVEEDYIHVVLKSSGKVVKELKNITEFKGRSRTSVSSDSWLGNFNIQQEAKGKKVYSVDDFEIVPKKRLKHETGATIDDQYFVNTKEVAHYYIDSWIESLKVQTTVQKILPILGEGKVHRHDLLLPEPYKAGRDGERPLLLKEIRQYLLEKYEGKMAPTGFEADEVVDAYGKRGYHAYLKTGKFTYIKSSPDKDAGNKEGLWQNYSKDFNFKVPQPFLIKTFKEDVGAIALDKDKIRGVGLKHMCYQLLMGDSADHYAPRTWLPEEVRPNISYGNVTFYKDFFPLKTQKELLQKLVDIFYEWFPEGVAYTAWNGEEAEFDTLGYLELLFSCAYMKDGPKDSTNLEYYLKGFKVDYKKICNNRITHETELVEEEVLKKIVHEAKALVEEALLCVEKKSGTKPVLVKSLEDTEELLKGLNTKLRSMFDTGK